MELIGMIIIGLVAGALARLLVPGRDPMGVLGTLLLGLVGGIGGGLVARALGDEDGVGLIGATIGAVVVLLIWRAVAGDRHHVTRA
jgi:uncharacterized membrane protein YeaQ/YmgE (transglycosylase-associated protein family)